MLPWNCKLNGGQSCKINNSAGMRAQSMRASASAAPGRVFTSSQATGQRLQNLWRGRPYFSGLCGSQWD